MIVEFFVVKICSHLYLSTLRMKQKRQDLYCNFPQIVALLIFSVSMYFVTCWIRGGKERRRRGEGKGEGEEKERRLETHESRMNIVIIKL